MIIELSGSHYEMGQQHGLKLLRYRPALLGLIADYQERAKEYPDEAMRAMVDEISHVLQVHSRQTLDMIHGIADSFELSRKDILSLMMESYFEDKLTSHGKTEFHEYGCTTWAFSGERDGEEEVLLAKNRDYLISHRILQVIFRCKPDNRNEYFSINSIGASNVFSSGINEEGLSIADTRIPSLDVGPGLPRFSLMMDILENFKYVNEVKDYLKSVPRMGCGSLIFADVKGDIGSAEIGYLNSDILQKDTGHLVCTNHFEGPSMKKNYRRISEAREKDSKWRFGKVSKKLLSLGEGIGPSDAIDLMSYHGEKHAICNHGFSNESKEIATISSVIFIPRKRGFYYCEGFPCSMPYNWIPFQ